VGLFIICLERNYLITINPASLLLLHVNRQILHVKCIIIDIQSKCSSMCVNFKYKDSTYNDIHTIQETELDNYI
jgi:hypothetical protein